MQKAKKYDWKDSNLALFGSDTEKQVKKDSAETEPAWKGAGQKIGLQIWRIVKFKVTHWRKEDYGKFYDGDSYIILHTYQKPDSEEFLYDLHFWIGLYSSQDEYGTAAYKTVELDTLLDDKPVQHREVQGKESELFKSYFKVITLMKGGADSGFRHVTKEEYKPRLLHFKGTKLTNVTVTEVPFAKTSVSSDDVFVYDGGKELLLWHGKNCDKDEKFKAIQYIQQLKGERSGGKSETIDERDSDGDKRFKDKLPDTADEEDDDEEEEEEFSPKLYRLSDASGQMEFSLESDGSIPEEKLDINDVFIADTGKRCFVWVGRGASRAEKQNAMSYAHQYLQGTKHPIISITVINDDDEPGRGKAAFREILS